MLRLSFRIRIAALCAIALSIVSTLPASALQDCSGFRPGEQGQVLGAEINKVRVRWAQTVRADSRQGCSSKNYEVLKDWVQAWERYIDFAESKLGVPTCPREGINTDLQQRHRNELKRVKDFATACREALGIGQTSLHATTNRSGASTPYPFDCRRRPPDANVAWYYSCNPPAESTELKRTAYRHPITPQQLYGKAYAVCRSVPVEQQRACIAEAKKNVLLAEDASIRTRCGTLSGEQQVHCVERYYLFGPDAGSPQNIRAYVQQAIDHQNKIDAALARRFYQIADERDRLAANEPRLTELDADDPRWSRLSEQLQIYSNAMAGIAPNPSDVETLAQTIEPAPLTGPQQLFDRVVRASVDAAIEANKAKLSEQDQKICAIAAHKAAWAVIGGGNAPKADPKCEQLVSDTVAQLAYQAANQFTANTPPEEDLLKHYLALHYANTKGKNDGTLDAPFEAKGLTPDEDMRKQGEQLLKKSE
jgi:hypothetical protein